MKKNLQNYMSNYLWRGCGVDMFNECIIYKYMFIYYLLYHIISYHIISYTPMIYVVQVQEVVYSRVQKILFESSCSYKYI